MQKLFQAGLGPQVQHVPVRSKCRDSFSQPANCSCMGLMSDCCTRKINDICPPFSCLPKQCIPVAEWDLFSVAESSSLLFLLICFGLHCATQLPCSDSHSGQLLGALQHRVTQPASSQCKNVFKQAWDHRSSMFRSVRSTVIHSVSQPTAFAWESCLFENIIIAHFTKFFQAGLGPPLSALLCACLPQCFPDQCHIWTQWYAAIQ